MLTSLHCRRFVPIIALTWFSRPEDIAVPFYEYVCVETTDCNHCSTPFTLLQRLSDPPLEHCPECGQAVRKIISPPNVVAGDAHKLNPSNVEKAGFTQYRKIGKGVYEKTAGKGPGVISAD
jgi:putative FmdB family regulatory protein